MNRLRSAVARGLAVALLSSACFQPALADVVFDGSLGSAGAAAVEPFGDGVDYRIPENRGRVVGSTSLFHSFGRFGIESGNAATFTGSAAIDQVFARVTGGEASEIHGLLRSEIGTADLYLLNPSGILFGPEARLDVPGSFVASTADEVHFANGELFGTGADGVVPMLAVAAPEAFGFISDAPAGILVDRAQLAVSGGETLGLIAGSVEIVGDGTGAVQSYLIPLDADLLDAAEARIEAVRLASLDVDLFPAFDSLFELLASDPILTGLVQLTTFLDVADQLVLDATILRLFYFRLEAGSDAALLSGGEPSDALRERAAELPGGIALLDDPGFRSLATEPGFSTSFIDLTRAFSVAVELASNPTLTTLFRDAEGLAPGSASLLIDLADSALGRQLLETPDRVADYQALLDDPTRASERLQSSESLLAAGVALALAEGPLAPEPAQLSAPAGTIQIQGVEGPGVVSAGPAPEPSTGRVTLRAEPRLDAAGGAIWIRGGDVVVDRARLDAPGGAVRLYADRLEQEGGPTAVERVVGLRRVGGSGGDATLAIEPVDLEIVPDASAADIAAGTLEVLARDLAMSGARVVADGVGVATLEGSERLRFAESSFEGPGQVLFLRSDDVGLEGFELEALGLVVEGGGGSVRLAGREPAAAEPVSRVDLGIGGGQVTGGDVTFENVFLQAEGAVEVEASGDLRIVSDADAFVEMSAGPGARVDLEGRTVLVSGVDVQVLGGTVAVVATDAFDLEGAALRAANGLVDVRAGTIRFLESRAEALGAIEPGEIRLAAEGELRIDDRSSVDATGLLTPGGTIELSGHPVFVAGPVAGRSGGAPGGNVTIRGIFIGSLDRVDVSGAPRGTITVEAEAGNTGGVVFDGSLGEAGVAEARLSGPSGPIYSYWIPEERGSNVGTSLLHSFDRFRVESFETAHFDGSVGLENVIARVTGGEGTRVDGKISSGIPGAGVFLIDPNGVVFGQRATLDVPASFHAGAVPGARLADGGFFAADLDTPLPEGDPRGRATLPLDAGQGGTLTLERSRLRTEGLATLELVGDEVRIASFSGLDTNRGTIRIVGSDVDIEDFVDLYAPFGAVDIEGDDVRIERPAITARDVSVVARQGDLVVTGPRILPIVGLIEGDRIHLEGRNVTVENTVVSAEEGTVDVIARDGTLRVVGIGQADVAQVIDANGGGTVTLAGREIVLEDAHVSADSTGTIAVHGPEGGRADRVVLDGALLSTSFFGDAGSIRVSADEIMGDRFAKLAATAYFVGEDAGEIHLDGRRIGLLGGTNLNAGALNGSGGRIVIEADESVRISNEGGGPFDPLENLASGALCCEFSGALAATVFGDQGGTVEIRAPNGRIEVVDRAVVSSLSASVGNPGTVLLEGGVVEIRDGGVVDTSAALAGAGGAVEVRASDRIVIAGRSASGLPAQVRAVSGGDGAGGTVILDAPRIEVDGGAVTTSSLPDVAEAAGERLGFPIASNETATAGDIVIRGSDLVVRNGGRIESSTFTKGEGGTIDVRMNRSVTVTGSGSVIEAKTADTGAGGDVTISAPTVRITDEGVLSAASRPGFGASRPIFLDVVEAGILSEIEDPAERALGKAGDLLVKGETVEILDGAILTDAPHADGGNIKIDASQLVWLRGAEVSASVGEGLGGNVSIDPVFVIVDGSRIVAQAGAGKGGAIDIVSDFFFQDPTSVIDASAGTPSLSGDVDVQAPDTDIAGTLTGLPTNFFDTAALLRERCAGGAAARAGSFAVLGPNPLPAPDGYLPAVVGARGARVQATTGVTPVDVACAD